MSRSSGRSPSRYWTGLLLVAVVAVPLVAATAPVLSGTRTFSFRDSASFYYPLFRWTSAEWSAGRVPLWNPHDNCGVPVLAEATSSVFYPGQLVFALPGRFALKYNAYVLAHLVLAALGAYGLARHWRATGAASALAALSYASGGSVLFQCSNVVFLVGAAWLPLGLLAALRLIERTSMRRVAALAGVLAMMVLGGDPQMAYHTCLAAVLLAVLRTHRDSDSVAAGLRGVWSHGRPLAAAAALAALFAAVQVVPSIEWMRRGDRAAFDRPRSVYEVPEYLTRFGAQRPRDPPLEGIVTGLCGPPAPGSHHEQIYHFSVGPWRLVEFVWPNVAGRLVPENRRWFEVIPAEGRVWSPTLYMGLLPLVLAGGAWSLRRRPDSPHPAVVWLSWLTLLAVIGSFGWFGAGWMVNELDFAMRGRRLQREWMGAPTGGLYWLMVVGLPMYAKFRYPAKLMVVAALGLSQLAAIGWDRRVTEPGRTPRRLMALSAASGLALLCVLLIHAWLAGRFARGATDDVLGPVDGAGAVWDLGSAFAHAAVVAGALSWVLWRRRHRGRVPALLLITAVELGVAHHALLPTADVGLWDEPSAVVQAIERSTGEAASGVRVYRSPSRTWCPAAWSRAGSPDRLAEVVAWDRDTLFPKYHLAAAIDAIDAAGTQQDAVYREFLAVARSMGIGTRRHRALLAWTGVEYWVLPESAGFPAETPVAVVELAERVGVWRQPGSRPRAWVVHETITRPEFDARDPASVSRQLHDTFVSGGPRDLERVAVVHGDGGDLPDQPAAVPSGAREPCRVTQESPTTVSIDVTLAEPGLVVLADLHYPGWVAQVTDRQSGATRPATVLRTNGWMRGVALDAGHYVVRYEYRPAGFYLGCLLSVVAVVGAGLLLAAPLGRSLRAARRGVRGQIW